jgi:hypothetical protein
MYPAANLFKSLICLKGQDQGLVLRTTRFVHARGPTARSRSLGRVVVWYQWEYINVLCCLVAFINDAIVSPFSLSEGGQKLHLTSSVGLIVSFEVQRRSPVKINEEANVRLTYLCLPFVVQ